MPLSTIPTDGNELKELLEAKRSSVSEATIEIVNAMAAHQSDHIDRWCDIRLEHCKEIALIKIQQAKIAGKMSVMLRHPNREREVIDEAKRHALSIGLDAETAAAKVEELMRVSRSIQREIITAAGLTVEDSETDAQ